MGQVKLIRPGVAVNPGGPVVLFPTVLAPFDISLGEGWTREGPRAFVWEGPTVQTSPRITLTGVEAGGVYDISLNITEMTGTSPFLHVRLGGTPDLDGITAAGAYSYQKAIANGGNNSLQFIIGTNTNADRVVIKSLFVNRVG